MYVLRTAVAVVMVVVVVVVVRVMAVTPVVVVIEGFMFFGLLPHCVRSWSI